MKTTSILESIRNKMKKIESSDAASENPAESGNPLEPHDDFEYIDDTSKNIVESKHNLKNTNTGKDGKSDNLESDDDFDFLNEDDEEEKNKPTKTAATPPVTPPKKPDDSKLEKIPAQKDDDFDLDDLDLEEDEPDVEKTAESKKSTLDDLDLEDIDVDDLEPKNNETPKSQEIEKDTLDLEKIFEEEEPMPETEVNKTPEAEAPKVEAPKMAEKNMSEISQAPTAQDDDIFKDDELEISPSEPVKIQNNYQESDKANMDNLNKSTIISEEIAKQTSAAIKDIIKSVPKPSQNHQVLSGSSPAFKSGETIEEMVAALLAPKLEQWINENLPPMVEKIVRKEIKRLLPDDHE